MTWNLLFRMIDRREILSTRQPKSTHPFPKTAVRMLSSTIDRRLHYYVTTVWGPFFYPLSPTPYFFFLLSFLSFPFLYCSQSSYCSRKKKKKWYVRPSAIVRPTSSAMGTANNSIRFDNCIRETRTVSISNCISIEWKSAFLAHTPTRWHTLAR